MTCNACGKPAGLRYWLTELSLLISVPLIFLSMLVVHLLVTYVQDGNPIKQWFWRRGMLGTGRYVYVTLPEFWHKLRCGI